MLLFGGQPLHEERVTQILGISTTDQGDIAIRENQIGGRHPAQAMEKRASRQPMIVYPRLNPCVLMLLVPALEDQAVNQSGGNAAVSAQGYQQSALGAGIAAAVRETFQGRHIRSIDARLIVDLLIDMMKEGFQL